MFAVNRIYGGPPSVRSGPTKSQPGDEGKSGLPATKKTYTAHGLARRKIQIESCTVGAFMLYCRGFHVGSPLERFGHSPFVPIVRLIGFTAGRLQSGRPLRNRSQAMKGNPVYRRLKNIHGPMVLRVGRPGSRAAP